MSLRAAVIGAHGGIGAALCRALAAEGAQVAALARTAEDPALRLDLTDEPSIARAAAGLGALDLVIVATGILHAKGLRPERSLRDLDGPALACAYEINAIGPALVAKHFLPLLPRTGRAVFAALSARIGSIGDNRTGGWHAYRASKAGLNMILRNIALEQARTRPQHIVLGLHPGTVATALSAPFHPTGAVFTPDQSAAHLLAVIAAATPAQSGQVLDWQGVQIPP